MLVAEHIAKAFGGIVALDDASIEVHDGEVVGLVGPNGSGKSTLLNVLSGFDRPDAGSVVFDGQRIDGRSPWDVAHLGLRRTFQLARQPAHMTVLEVMLAGGHLPAGTAVWQTLLRPRAVRREEDAAIARARELLDELQLRPLADHAAAKLSGGQQKLLSFGAALMGEPSMLLLDEPTAGVNPTLRRTLAEHLRAIRRRGTTLVIVEHDMGFIAELCDRVYVLDKGRGIALCRPDELADDPRVVEAYLGSARPGARRGPRPAPVVPEARR